MLRSYRVMDTDATSAPHYDARRVILYICIQFHSMPMHHQPGEMAADVFHDGHGSRRSAP
jgi:hypothetical protein